MKKCNIVQDLIPLYVEGLANPESSKFIDQHLANCATCSQYVQRVQQDFEQQAVQRKPERIQVDQLVSKIAQYQQNIKLAAVLTAILLSCIISGASVPFLSTIPFLIIIPFVCRLYMNKTFLLIASALPFGLIGGMLSDQDASFIPFFTIVALLAVSVSVGAGALWKYGLRQIKTSSKLVYFIPAVAVIILSSLMYFSFWGNPVGYVDAMIRTRDYVNKNYEEGTLTLKQIRYNFKDSRHYGIFEYVLNGTRQHASISIDSNGHVIDDYQFVLEMQFSEERSADLKAEILAAIDFSPVHITASPIGKLNITHDELNDRYYHLSYDIDRRNKATAQRASESSKLQYIITLGAFSGEYDVYSKEEFMEKAEAVLNVLQQRNIPFHQVEMKATLPDLRLQTISFTPQTSFEQLNQHYETVQEGSS